LSSTRRDREQAPPSGTYQPQQFAIETNNKKYLDEIEDLRHQLMKAKDHSKYQDEILDLKHQLRRANQESKQLRDDYDLVEKERDQERQRSKDHNQGQSRQVEEVQERLYQKDRELNDLRAELGSRRNQHEEAKQTMMDQENKIRQVE
jgi:chromosome segregation ATPase